MLDKIITKFESVQSSKLISHVYKIVQFSSFNVFLKYTKISFVPIGIECASPTSFTPNPVSDNWVE